MKKLTISDSSMILALQDEIRRSHEARYDHRLHGILLVAQGMSSPEVGRLLGDAPRTVQYWVQRFEKDGLQGLAEGDRPGRPTRLKPKHLETINRALRKPPGESGLSVHLWDGKTLAEFVRKKHGISLGVRQCQRLFHQLDFRLRKPRPLIARADPVLQETHKKTPELDERPHR